MDISQLIETYGPLLEQRYHHRLLPSHRRALDAMTACRKSCGEIIAQCEQCSHTEVYPLSCGHRSCPKCQNHDTTAWLNRQLDKLLPVPYFMTTFTLPKELRQTAWSHQYFIYSAMFKAAAETLKEFGLNAKNLGAQLGMTGVLHTHSRRLDHHPHIHFIVPGGGVDCTGKKAIWRKVKNNYLFNEQAIARVFRGKLLYAIIEEGIQFPKVPVQWIVDCEYIGTGEPALKYLSRYLYRGVIAEHKIVSDENGMVTFLYEDSETKKTLPRRMKGEDFLWQILQHVLPRGFRRVRDYGFLHANAKRLLKLVQLTLSVKLPKHEIKVRPFFICKLCKNAMNIVHVMARKIPFNPIFRAIDAQTKNRLGVT